VVAPSPPWLQVTLEVDWLLAGGSGQLLHCIHPDSQWEILSHEVGIFVKLLFGF
jgi:hypothetical protein